MTVERELAPGEWSVLALLAEEPGHGWALATHKEDVNPAEMEKRQKAFAAEMAQKQNSPQQQKH